MYCINPLDEEPIFCLFNQIGKDEANPLAPYVDGNDFARELLYMDGEGKKAIHIWINSEGGSVKDGYSICAAMLKTKTKINTLNVGVAYSMAGVILSMGRKREAFDYTSAMCHNPLNPDGTEDKGFEVIRKSLVTMLAGRMGKSEKDVEAIMNAETYYSAAEAKEAGLIDEIIMCGEKNVPRGSTADTIAIQNFGLKYVAKLLPNKDKKIITMKTVAKSLGLNEEASEEAINAEVKKLQALAKKAKEKDNDDEEEEEDSEEDKVGDKKKAKKEKMKQEARVAIAAKAKASGLTLEDKDVDRYVALAGNKEALNIVLSEIEEKGKAAAKAAADLVSAKAKTEIVKKLNERNITADDKQIERYVALAGTTEIGLKAVIETIEAIPVTVKSAKITEFTNLQGKDGKGPKAYNAARIMDDIYKKTKVGAGK